MDLSIFGSIAIQENLFGKEAQNLSLLSKERDVRLYYQGLFHLAERLEQSRHDAGAAQIYQHILLASKREENRPYQSFLSQLAKRAETRLAALNGEAESFIDRFDIFARDLTREVLHPANLIPMLFSPFAFRIAQSWMLGALGESAAGLLTRGAGARAIANLFGFAVETASFTSLTQGVLTACAVWEGTAPPAPSFNDLAKNALFLAPIKGATYASKQLAFVFPKVMRSLLGKVFSQVILYDGALLGHGLQEFFNLTKPMDFSHHLTASLATLVHLHLSGRVNQHLESLLGPAWANWKLSVERRAQQFAEKAEHPSRFGKSWNQMIPLQMAAYSEKNGKPIPTYDELVKKYSDLANALQKAATAGVLLHVDKITEQIPNFQKLLAHSTIRDSQMLERTLLRLEHAVEVTRPDSSLGSYPEWVMRVAVEYFAEERNQSAHRIDTVLRLIDQGGRFDEMEKTLAKILPDQTIKRVSEVSNFGRFAKKFLGEEGEATGELSNWMANFEAKRKTELLHESFLKTGPFNMSRELMRVSEDRSDPKITKIKTLIENAIIKAAASPLGHLRMIRLQYVIAQELDEMFFSKMGELISDPVWMSPAIPALPHTSREIINSQYDAYFGEADMAELLAPLHADLPNITDPAEMQARRNTSEEALSIFLKNRAEGFLTTEDITKAYQALGDGHSLELADRIASGKLPLTIATDENFEAAAKKALRDSANDASDWVKKLPAFYALPNQALPQGMIYVRGFNPSEKPDLFSKVLEYVVHENEHFEHDESEPNVNRTYGTLVTQEMKANIREETWKARHGRGGWLLDLYRKSNLGLAFGFRNYVEGVWRPRVEVISRGAQ